jgi:acylphosphatase
MDGTSGIIRSKRLQGPPIGIAAHVPTYMHDGIGMGFPHPPRKGDDGRSPWFPVEAASVDQAQWANHAATKQRDTIMSSSKTSIEIIARRVLISGKVQGVGFRYSLAERARNLNIQGWCRNLPDGRLEAWLQGTLAPMTEILAWIEQGPPQSVVEHVDVENQAVLEPMLSETIQTFEIRK